MHILRKTSLALALAGLSVSAFAQQTPPPPTNPFVAQAASTTSPGFAPVAQHDQPLVSGVPNPPTPPSSLQIPSQLGTRLPGSNQAQRQAVREAFGHVPAQQPPQHGDFLANGLIEHARPGQTLTAPALPQMPPLPQTIPAPIQMAAGSAVGLDRPIMSTSQVLAQTQLVKNLSFQAEQGKTYRMVMSAVAPNMLESPFEHPKLIVADRTAVNFDRHGKSLLVTVADGAPIGAYITGTDPNDPLIALVFEPRAVPPQNYEMHVKGFIEKKDGSANSVVQGTSEEYTQRVVAVLDQVVQGLLPDGFGVLSKQDWPMGRDQSGLIVQPSKVMSSGTEMIDVLDVTNSTTHAVALEENDFYQQGVEAVALSQHTPLQPGQTLQVDILRRASHADANDTLMSVSRP